MKVRIKFTKTDSMRFIGHLDLLRFFEKAIRRSGIQAAFTKGYSPHMILSFAAPLGVGLESIAEYFDIELAYAEGGEIDAAETERLKDIGLVSKELPPLPSSRILASMLQNAMPEGCRILSVRKISAGKGNKAMALVQSALYRIDCTDNSMKSVFSDEKIREFLQQEHIIIHKKTKKSEGDAEIRPLIHKMTVSEENGDIFIACATGSAANLKPETVMEALCSFCGLPFDESAIRIRREELYTGGEIPLDSLGEDF